MEEQDYGRTETSFRVVARRVSVHGETKAPGFAKPAERRTRKLRAGGKGIRTPGLLIANETLYQLSYTPVTLGQ